ncbi:hypothetical protein K456DRAFT_1839330 [Colletotrichum gloeosporioides 23]|nr:hypothetical protein K456DRAFT_1839330 [Colletotrichum gloeosporioides 23]
MLTNDSLDNIGLHYSATLWRWYKNWTGNRDKITAKYGEKSYRIWEYFLAMATIIFRQGTMGRYQITLVKNLNGVHRAGLQQTRFSVAEAMATSRAAGKNRFPI